MVHRGSVYQCVQPTLGGCNRSIRAAEIERVIGAAVLATFSNRSTSPCPVVQCRVRIRRRALGWPPRLTPTGNAWRSWTMTTVDGLIDKAMGATAGKDAERIERTPPRVHRDSA